MSRPDFGLAVVHHPVYDKNRREIVASITNLDIHDLSRLVKTYGGRFVAMVTPIRAQQEMIMRIVDHWRTGFGSRYNPTRFEALEMVRVASDLGELVEEEGLGDEVVTIATSARRGDTPAMLQWNEVRNIVWGGKRFPLFLLGTGWGIAEGLLEGCHYRLPPIEGVGSYNHLSVRCAASIIVDRVVAGREG